MDEYFLIIDLHSRTVNVQILAIFAVDRKARKKSYAYPFFLIRDN